jgi:hypothetical protein
MATVAVIEQWADPQALASTSAAAASAQMPFLALLQGVGIMVDQGHQDGRKRNTADLDLLESCVTPAQTRTYGVGWGRVGWSAGRAG